MYTQWTAHLTDAKEKELFERNLYGSKTSFRRLMAILEEYEKELNETELDQKSYAIANWALLQSDIVGAKRIIKKIKKLIDLDAQQTIKDK